MDRKTENALIEELLELKKADALHAHDDLHKKTAAQYVGAEQFQLESQLILQKLPQAGAHISELAKAGDFVRRDIGGRSVIITRNKAGEIKAFLNACRHRGTRLVDEETGCRHRFSCPYHAWTYDNDGSLIGAPHFDAGFADIEKSELSLIRLPCQVVFGLVWVIADPNSSDDIGHFFADVEEDLTALNLDDMVIAAQDESQRAANWKIIVEGGIEAYHFRVAHRKTIGPYFEDNLSTYQMLGPHIRSVLARPSLADLPSQNQKNWRLRDHANILYSLFPTTNFLVQSDHVVWITQTPLAPNKTKLRIATLVPKSDLAQTDHWQKSHAITIKTLDEDFDIGESIQENLDAGAVHELIFGRFEGALTKFSETVQRFLEK